jgi:uncharacterized membrane protein required for colicin V production
MSIVDIGIILALILFPIIGWMRGVIKETVSLVGLIAVFIISYTFKEEIGNVLCKFLPFLTFSGNIKGLVSLNILIYQMIGFITIFSILFLAYQIIVLVSGLLQTIIKWTKILDKPSKILGAIVGGVCGYLIIFAVLLVSVVAFQNHEEMKKSFLSKIIVYKTPIISYYTKDISATVNNIYDLVEDLENEEISINKANLEIIDTMIKYDVVSKKTVEQLVVLDKLKKVKGLDNVLEKYE